MDAVTGGETELSEQDQGLLLLEKTSPGPDLANLETMPGKDVTKSWDKTLPAELCQDFIQSLQDRQEIQKTTFSGRIAAAGATGLPHLVMFSLKEIANLFLNH